MPGGSVGRVERSQRTELAIAQREFWAVDVDDITDEDRQLGWIKLVDLPRGTVARGDVDERRPDVHVGIVGPDVVFWNVSNGPGASSLMVMLMVAEVEPPLLLAQTV